MYSNLSLEKALYQAMVGAKDSITTEFGVFMKWFLLKDKAQTV